MKSIFVDGLISFISKNMECDNNKLLRLSYGLESIYLTITKLVLITLFSIILGVFKTYIVTLILFNIIRFFGFGFHADKSSTCFIFSSGLFVGLPYIFEKFSFNIYLILIIEAIALFILLLYAPADTVKRPLPNSKKRLFRKISTVLIAIIYIILTILLDCFMANTLCISLMIEAIMVSPITYKFFGQPYRNYLNYKKA